jgi:hypothetical protein
MLMPLEQTLGIDNRELLINKVALLFAKYLRNEKSDCIQEWNYKIDK